MEGVCPRCLCAAAIPLPWLPRWAVCLRPGPPVGRALPPHPPRERLAARRSFRQAAQPPRRARPGHLRAAAQRPGPGCGALRGPARSIPASGSLKEGPRLKNQVYCQERAQLIAEELRALSEADVHSARLPHDVVGLVSRTFYSVSFL